MIGAMKLLPNKKSEYAPIYVPLSWLKYMSAMEISQSASIGAAKNPWMILLASH
jgi:hypothetical protein